MKSKALPLTEDEVREIIDMRIAGRTYEEITEWLGCTWKQVEHHWKKYKASQQTKPAGIDEVLKSETREAAQQMREQPADPYKPGDLRWEPQ